MTELLALKIRAIIAPIWRSSGLYKCAAAVFGFFARVWDASFLKRLVLSDFGYGGALGESFTGGAINALERFFAFTGRKLGRVTESSVFIKFCRAEFGVYALIFAAPILPTKYILALALLTVLIYFIQLVAGRVKLRFNAVDMFVVLFVLTLGRSLAVSYGLSDSLPVAAVYLLFIAVYFAVKSSVDTREKLYAAAVIAAASGTLVSLYGIWQKVTDAVSRDLWIDNNMFEDLAGRVYSTLENPNVLGTFLILVMPVSAALLYGAKTLLGKCAALFSLGVMGYCMILTLSRGAWLGLILAVAVFALINDRRLVWLGLILVVLAPLIIPRSILDRFLSIGNTGDSSTNYRIFIWIASLSMLKIFWPSGIGLGESVFVLIYSRFSYNAVFSPHSHNLFLQTAITLGAVGLFALLGICFSAAKGAVMARSKTTDKFGRMFGGALVAALAGFMLQGMTDNVWYNYRVTCLFWIMIAVCGANALACKEKEEKL